MCSRSLKKGTPYNHPYTSENNSRILLSTAQTYTHKHI